MLNGVNGSEWSQDAPNVFTEAEEGDTLVQCKLAKFKACDSVDIQTVVIYYQSTMDSTSIHTLFAQGGNVGLILGVSSCGHARNSSGPRMSDDTAPSHESLAYCLGMKTMKA